MSKRTFEASKAIREAWERERLLVLQGEGTRDWTQEQQQSIIDKGKAYDDDGRAIEGHHMKSVETYPEYQGDPDNIQFLTREEHLDAHHGSFQQPTNGYYNPETKETEYFDDREPNPCPIIKLSNPLVIVENNADEATSNSISEPDTSSEATGAVPVEESNLDSTLREEIVPVEIIPKPTEPKKPWGGIRETIGKAILKAYEFSNDHPLATLIIKETVKAVAQEAKVEIVNRLFESNTASYEESSYDDSVYMYTSSSTSTKQKARARSDRPDSSIKTNSPAPERSESPNQEDHVVQRAEEPANEADISSKKNYPDSRSSPKAHTVRGYDKIQNGKKIHVDSYPRGGKKGKNEE